MKWFKWFRKKPKPNPNPIILGGLPYALRSVKLSPYLPESEAHDLPGMVKISLAGHHRFMTYKGEWLNKHTFEPEALLHTGLRAEYIKHENGVETRHLVRKFETERLF